jgi:aminopeptidase N
VFAPGAEIGGSRNVPHQTADAEFGFTITRPSYFSFAAARYTIERRRSSNGTQTSAYLLRPRPRIGNFLDGCVRVLDTLTQEFGANPYGEFALVEVPTEQARRARFDGASGEGFIFSNGNFLDADFNVAYYGHEIAHQWWGVAIGRKWWESSRGRLMLDEAMAQYGSLRAVETIEGTRTAERYRRTGYPGYIDFHNADGYFMVEAGGFDQKLSDLPDGEVSRIIADSKGFLVFDMLSRTVGRENYRRILRGIARRYAFGNLSWDEFLRLVETGAGRNLQWFYAQWFERAGAPEWNFEWRQEGNTLRGIITQSPPFYRATVELLIEGDDNRNFVRSVELRGERTELTLPVNFRVRAATVDPHFLVLHRTPEYRALRSAMGAYLRSNIEREQGKFDAAERLLREALAQEATPDLYGSHFTLELGLGQLLLAQNKFAEAKEHLEAAIASPSRRANVLPWAYFYLARVAKELNDVILLRRAVDGAITADTGVGGRTGVSRQARALIPTSRGSEQ